MRWERMWWLRAWTLEPSCLNANPGQTLTSSAASGRLLSVSDLNHHTWLTCSQRLPYVSKHVWVLRTPPDMGLALYAGAMTITFPTLPS